MPSEYGPMTLGELIAALEATYKNEIPEYTKPHGDRQVYFDWCNLRPDSFHSYRGYYDHLAITFRGHPSETVKEFIARCREQVGATHQGWKGGDFTMDEETPVWVSESGDNSGFGIVGVEDRGYGVILKTQYFK